MLVIALSLHFYPESIFFYTTDTIPRKHFCGKCKLFWGIIAVLWHICYNKHKFPPK